MWHSTNVATTSKVLIKIVILFSNEDVLSLVKLDLMHDRDMLIEVCLKKYFDLMYLNGHRYIGFCHLKGSREKQEI